MAVEQRARWQALVVTGGVTASNASGYLLTVVAARVLAPDAFGELSALLAVLLVGVVPAMGVQTAVALRRAGRPDESPRPLVGLGIAVAVGMAAVAGLAVPLVSHLLRASDPTAVLWLAVAIAPLTLNGLWHGLLQGRERFALYGVVITGEAVCRVGGALAGLALTGATSGAMAGLAAGAVVSATVGWVACGRPVPARFPTARLGEALHAGQTLLGTVLLINFDVVLARHVLPGASGEYAVGAVLTKVAYWLPHAVAVMALPKLTGERRARAVTTGLATCAALDGVVVLGSVLFRSEALAAIGGPAYADSGLALWPFAVTGSMLAAAQVLLFARIADGDRRASLITWAAVGVEVLLVLAWLNRSPVHIAVAAVVATTLLVAVGVLVESRARHARTT